MIKYIVHHTSSGFYFNPFMNMFVDSDKAIFGERPLVESVIASLTNQSYLTTIIDLQLRDIRLVPGSPEYLKYEERLQLVLIDPKFKIRSATIEFLD